MVYLSTLNLIIFFNYVDGGKGSNSINFALILVKMNKNPEKYKILKVWEKHQLPWNSHIFLDF